MKLTDLKPNRRNPRGISPAALDRLAESIERDPAFMELRPIVVDAENNILGGNQRYRALQKLGRKEVPDSWVVKAKDLTPEQKRRFILVDNAPEGMAGYWDFEMLQEEYPLPELEELGFDLAENLNTDVEKEKRLAEMEIRPFEHWDYLVFIFDNQHDWLFVCSNLDIEHRETSPTPKATKIGLGRILKGSKLANLIKALPATIRAKDLVK